MGSKQAVRCNYNHCDEHGDEISLNCFKNDQFVQYKECTRIFEQKWKWTAQHEAMLNQALDQQLAIGNILFFAAEIASFVDSDKNDWPWIDSHSGIYEEAYYTCNRALLNKTLCREWYSKYFGAEPHFNISIICKNVRLINKFCNGLCQASMPSLQRVEGDELFTTSFRRVTCFVDDHFFSVGLSSYVDVRKASPKQSHEPAHVSLVLVDAKDGVEGVYGQIEDLCIGQKLSDSDVDDKPLCIMLVRVGSHQHNKKEQQEIQLLCSQYNLCLTELKLSGKQTDVTLEALIPLAIKYYWFRCSTIS